ncbi:uroporphyrinogen decarboxylase family protein [uncultured Victivallis sp.]|uniref:uroporphyrinogen decarboxylase family protein n=1 Tax=uncultured Victivallis sp. TaxID=354118 RepID=UPI0025EADA46|nr:uroporphyrinogen decarboxylase family protein [uncultured Victivallis sp.]
MSFAATSSEAAAKVRNTYAGIPESGFIQRDFGLWMCIDAWRSDGLPEGSEEELFSYEPAGKANLWGLGWTEAALVPAFPERILEDRGETEIVQDRAGRGVLYFKGRRQGFMPEYVSHPVTDMRSWQENVKPRMQFDQPGRIAERKAEAAIAKEAYERNHSLVCQNIIGGYMYLRSLFGPEALLYAFYDMPEVVHDCMKSWLELADAVTALHQKFVTIEEVFFGEDICYNHGPLISPEMIREFLFPYYQQLLTNIRRRQPEHTGLYIQLDTDGDAQSIIDLYVEGIGCNIFSPFEVASGSDVVAIGRKYPEIVLTGGFDKRILAAGRAAIDREVDRIFPIMFKRGGYWPTCDHGVPAEVNWRDYLHFRKRCLEFA